jgi:hypothetical protein
MLADAAIVTYADTGSMTKASKATGLDHDTVKRLLARNPEAVAEARKRIASESLSLSSLAYTQANKHLPKLKDPYKLTLIGKIAGQGALEMLDLLPSGIQINIAVLSQSGDALEKLRLETEAIRLAMARPAVEIEPDRLQVKIASATDSPAE